MTEVDPDDMIPPAEAARVLQQKKTTLATWRSQGKGPRYLKVGRHPFYLRHDLRAWLATQLVEKA